MEEARAGRPAEMLSESPGTHLKAYRAFQGLLRNKESHRPIFISLLTSLAVNIFSVLALPRYKEGREERGEGERKGRSRGGGEREERWGEKSRVGERGGERR